MITCRTSRSSKAFQSAASRTSKIRTPYPRLRLQGGHPSAGCSRSLREGHHIAGCNRSPGHLPGPKEGDACQPLNYYTWVIPYEINQIKYFQGHIRRIGSYSSYKFLCMRYVPMQKKFSQLSTVPEIWPRSILAPATVASHCYETKVNISGLKNASSS